MAQQRRRRSDKDAPQNHERDMRARQADSDAISQRAYELYERRGRQHGSDWEDWFAAEREMHAASRQ